MTPCCPIMAQKLLDQTKFFPIDFGAQIQNRLNQMLGGKTEILFSVLWLISGRDLSPAELQHTHTHAYAHTHTHTANQTHTGALLDSTSYIIIILRVL